MKPTVLIFMKIFTFMTLVYGGMQFLTYSFWRNGEDRLTQSLISSLGFGLVMSLFLTYTQVREIKKLRGSNFTTQDLSVHQAVHVHSTFTQTEILQKLQNHYPAKDWKIIENGNKISLKTTYSWKSFGEKIELKAGQGQNGFTEVFIESKPRFWLTITDYGKNLGNIIYLRNLLTAV